MEAVEPRRRWHPLAAAVRGTSRALWTRSQRAIFVFTMASLLRSRRHLMTLATYLGLGIALAGTRLLSAKVRGQPLPIDEPFDYLLAIPLVLTFFLALGVRAAFAVPTDLGANWIFRVAGPREAVRHAPAERLACGAIAVAPVTAFILLAGGVLWDTATASQVALMHAASGALLVALVLAGQNAVPFTRAHAMSPDTLKVSAPLGVLAVHVYAFRLDDLQRWALGATSGPLWYAGGMTLLTAIAVLGGRWWFGRAVTTFDAPADSAVTLSLSEANQ
jgi:hypothetical protein